MSSIRKEMAEMHKKQLKLEEDKNNNVNQPIVNENADIDIDKIAKEADKEANEILAKVVKESKPKKKAAVKKPEAVVKTKTKIIKPKVKVVRKKK